MECQQAVEPSEWPTVETDTFEDCGVHLLPAEAERHAFKYLGHHAYHFDASTLPRLPDAQTTVSDPKSQADSCVDSGSTRTGSFPSSQHHVDWSRMAALAKWCMAWRWWVATRNNWDSHGPASWWDFPPRSSSHGYQAVPHCGDSWQHHSRGDIRWPHVFKKGISTLLN